MKQGFQSFDAVMSGDAVNGRGIVKQVAVISRDVFVGGAGHMQGDYQGPLATVPAS